MKIASSDIQLAGQHQSLARSERQESMRFWVGARPTQNQGVAAPPPAPRPDALVLSDEARNFLSNVSPAAPEATGAQQVSEEDALDPKLKLLKLMIEALTGEKIKVISTAELQGRITQSSASAQTTSAQTASAPNWGLQYDLHETFVQTDSVTFSASGIVKTADGQEIKFNLSFSMSRQIVMERELHVRMGNAALTDPLVLNFTGTAAELTDQTFAFDLNADGTKEQVPFVRGGSGILAFDRNHDGIINDGRELFGPRTGNGFAELARYDDDHNGWIDENDAIYQELHVWSRDAEGNDQLTPLTEAGVGAIYLRNARTPFALRGDDHTQLGQLQSSSVYVTEDQQVGTVQQVDLASR